MRAGGLGLVGEADGDDGRGLSLLEGGVDDGRLEDSVGRGRRRDERADPAHQVLPLLHQGLACRVGDRRAGVLEECLDLEEVVHHPAGVGLGEESRPFGLEGRAQAAEVLGDPVSVGAVVLEARADRLDLPLVSLAIVVVPAGLDLEELLFRAGDVLGEAVEPLLDHRHLVALALRFRPDLLDLEPAATVRRAGAPRGLHAGRLRS